MAEIVNTHINGKYELLLPKHRAEREQWSLDFGGWEVGRIEAMLETIKSTDVVFDLGTEEGDISALIMKQTGCDMVLFEPNSLVYPCIRAIWEANKLKKPLDFYKGFLSDKTTVPTHKVCTSFEDIDLSKMIPDHGFAALSDGRPDIPQMTLDDYCALTGIYPDVITADIEGAEFQFVKGAINTLKKYRPTIFMSLHPDFMFESYRHEGEWRDKFGDDKQRVVHLLRSIDELGYRHEIIEWDYHECHAVWYAS